MVARDGDGVGVATTNGRLTAGSRHGDFAVFNNNILVTFLMVMMRGLVVIVVSSVNGMEDTIGGTVESVA